MASSWLSTRGRRTPREEDPAAARKLGCNASSTTAPVGLRHAHIPPYPTAHPITTTSHAECSLPTGGGIGGWVVMVVGWWL